MGLKLAKRSKAKRLIAFSDSQLVIGQVNQGLEVKEQVLPKYLDLVIRLKGQFEQF